MFGKHSRSMSSFWLFPFQNWFVILHLSLFHCVKLIKIPMLSSQGLLNLVLINFSITPSLFSVSKVKSVFWFPASPPLATGQAVFFSLAFSLLPVYYYAASILGYPSTHASGNSFFPFSCILTTATGVAFLRRSILGFPAFFLLSRPFTVEASNAVK